MHEDRRSILALDRPPLRWEGRRGRGLAWSERIGPVATDALASWEDVASVGAGCGLLIGGRQRAVHASVAGVAPLYWTEAGGAVYFASAVDALVAAHDGLTIDWEAWAPILTLDYPLGDRTPFAEIRRLMPFSTLHCRRGCARVEEHRWPWAEVEPTLDVESGAPAVVESLRAAIAEVPAGPVICELSGGLDSRLCLALLADSGRREETTAVTVDPDTPHDRDLRISARVAEAAGVPHEVVRGAADEFWPQFELRSSRVDYQLVRSPWRMPKLARLRDDAVPIVDGFGFDTLAVPGERFLMREAIAPEGDRAVVRALLRRLRSGQVKGGTVTALKGDLGKALWSITRRRFMAESERFAGHPARAVLTLYWTRQVRGISKSHLMLGTDVPLAMPLVDDRVARAALAITPASKYGQRLYRAVFEAVNPGLGELESTSGGRDTAPVGRRRSRRFQSEPVADALRETLAEGPLTPWLKPRVGRLLSRHLQGRPPRTERAFVGPALFHLWHQRYRDVLGDVEPGDVQ